MLFFYFNFNIRNIKNEKTVGQRSQQISAEERVESVDELNQSSDVEKDLLTNCPPEKSENASAAKITGL